MGGAGDGNDKRVENSGLSLVTLIHLDRAVDDAQEPEASKETNRAREEEKGCGSQSHVTEINQCRCELGHVELREEVDDRVPVPQGQQ